MPRTDSITISTPAGSLSGVIHLPDRAPSPVVVCCHGLLSSKDSSKYVGAGEEFSKGGFAVVRFDFSGRGSSPASLGDNLLGSRMRDLHGVLDYVAEQSWAARGETMLLGSSLGGYLALLAAASRSPNIRAVVCWATPFDLRKVEEALEAQQTGEGAVAGGRTLGSPRDLESLPPVPRVLIIHGQEDEIVPWKEALSIYEQVGEPRRLVLMRSADHRFLDPDCRRLAMRLSLEWFQDHVGIS